MRRSVDGGRRRPRLRRLQWLSVGRLAGPLRRLAPPVALSVMASLLVVSSIPVHRDAALPAGASRTPPSQAQATAAGRTHEATTAQTTAPARGGAATAAGTGPLAGDPKPPPWATGVVGREVTYPDPVPNAPGAQLPGGGKPPAGSPSLSNQRVEFERGAVTGFVPGVSRELPEKRTPRSTTFANPDGTKTTRLFSGPAHVPDSAGRMVPIDTTLTRTDDSRFRPVAAEDVSFAASSTDSNIAVMRFGPGLEASFGVEGVAAVTGQVTGGDLRFPDVRPHADLVVGASRTGVKDLIVLKSLDAPTTWRFPLHLRGLTPRYDAESGAVDLLDSAGTMKGTIPPGYMVDSAPPDPRTGTGARSNRVFYRLDKARSGWVLEVSIDEGWFRDPARVFPVTVDPAYRYPGFDDTFVSTRGFANRDNSNEPFMNVGTYDGGGEVAAAYVRFALAETELYRKYILGASLNVYSVWSRDCVPTQLNVYRVAESWFEAGPKSWPGPLYDPERPVASKTFARGHYCNNAGWESIALDPDRLTQWTHFWERWYGVTLRASSTNNSAEKMFYTTETFTNTSGAPFLDVVFSDQGAYHFASDRIDPPVTPTTPGRLVAWAQNLGTSDWTSTNGYKLNAFIYNSSGVQVKRVQLPVTTMFGGTPASRITSTETAEFVIEPGPLPAGSYSIRISMADPSGRLFDEYYGVPRATATFTVTPATPPVVLSYHPPNNARSDSLRPTLWAQYYDADNGPGEPRYWFKVCNGTAEAPVGCQETGWIESPTHTVPAGMFSWGETSHWFVAVYDGANMTSLQGPYHVTPVVAQPEVTHHLAGAADNSEAAGLNPQVGNYSTTVTDASVRVTGPPLQVARTYNSQDPRVTGAFGAGWSTSLDQRLSVDSDGSGNVVVTLASGRQVRFGRNTDGTYAPPPGHTMTLVRLGTSTSTTGWVLREATGERRDFDAQGQLTGITDASGRRQLLVYTGGDLTQVRDAASGRSLYLTWAGGHVTTVTTDAPAAGAAQPTWTYEYSGDRLMKVCSPLSASSCTRYEYTTSSHYRSVVLDSNPVAYFPLSETSGATAANIAARRPNELDGTFSGVALNQPGALAGSSDGSVAFDGARKNAVVMPDNLVTNSMAFAVEFWFKVPNGRTGVLFGEQNTGLDLNPARFSPALYIQYDGRLHGSFWSPNMTHIVTANPVDDNAWHHVVLSVDVNRQDLYLDGALVGTADDTVAHQDMARSALGNGYTSTWPGAGSSYFPFTGQIDEFAVYRHPLGQLQVAAHYAARTATSRLTTVIEPGDATTLHVSYDGASGRASTIRDRHGALWTVGAPVVGDGVRTVSLASTGRDPVSYTYDAMRGGRLVSTLRGSATEKWEYDANGFVASHLDANGHKKWFFNDARGNLTAQVVSRDGIWHGTGFRYHLNAADPLDPRNDRVVWRSGARNNYWESALRNGTTFDLDSAAHVTKVTYPQPAGVSAAPTDVFTYTTGTEAAVGGGTMPPGLLLQATNRLGGVTTYAYDARGDLRRTVDPAGLTTDLAYDGLGRPVEQTTSGVTDGAAVTYGTRRVTYTPTSLPVTETAPGIVNPITGVAHTALTRYVYDDAGRVRERRLEDATGGDATRVWAYTYDPAGHPSTTTAPDGGVTTQGWNTAGDMAFDVSPNGLRREYRYDDARRLVEVTAVGAGVDPVIPAATRLTLESRAYDPAGRLATHVDAIGRETAFTYYDDGSLATQTRVRRDGQGNITSTVELRGLEYDYGGLVSRIVDAGGVVRDLDYDDAGNLVRSTLDATGQARTTTYTRTADGQVATERHGSGFGFLPNRDAEHPRLLTAGGSLIDAGGNRYADGTATWTYKLQLPADTSAATVTMELDNQFVVHVSGNNTNWTEVLRETRDIGDGSNRALRSFNVDRLLSNTAKTVFVRIGDSQPADGWGGRLWRVGVDVTRAGAPARQTTYRYDTSGRTTGTTVANPGGDPASLATDLTLDSRGLVTTASDPAGARTDFTYDAAGALVTRIGPPRTTWVDGVPTDNHRPQYTIGGNAFGDATEHRDATGQITRTTYDGMGRAVEVIQPPYTPPGGSPLNRITRAEYDPMGNPLKVTDPLGRLTTSAYDLFGRVRSRTMPDPDGAGPEPPPVWRYTYDRAGERVETIDPTGAQSLATFNDLGHQVTATVGERGSGGTVYYTTALGRDPAGRLTSDKTPLGHTTSYAYNGAGDLVTVTDPVGTTVEQRYTPHGDLAARILAGARATSYGYDAAGRRIRESTHTVTAGKLSAPLATTVTGHDAMGRPNRVTSPQGRVTTYTHDLAGNRTGLSQLVNPADPASAVTVAFGYDAEGRHTRTTDGNGNATVLQYTAGDLLAAVVEPATAAHPNAADRTWTTTYDAAAQPVTTTAPGGIRRTREFNGLGHLVSESGTGAPAATDSRGVTSDAVGRITGVTGPGGVTSYTWNDRGLLTAASGPAGNATFGYDADGNLTSRVDAAGTATFTYDAAGRTKTITDPLTTRVATMGYRPTGELHTITYGTGLPSRTYGYDDHGRLATDTVTRADGAAAISTSYGYDSDGLLTQRVTTGLAGAGTNAFGYDGLTRLTSWTRPDGVTVGYGYDNASNRTTETVSGSTRTATFDQRNRLLAITGGGQPDTTNTWSARGTLDTTGTATQPTNLTYDAFDRLTRAQASGSTVSYTYDALDRIAARNGVATAYADLSNDAVRTPDALIARGPAGAPLSTRAGAATAHTLVTDPTHGDVTAAVDATSGAVAASRTYTPWGATHAAGGTLPLGFQGGYTDPDTGQVNAHARWYTPTLASFTTRDDVAPQPDIVAQANRYLYGNASPTTYADPDGHFAILGIVAAVVGVAAAVAGYVTIKDWVDSGGAGATINALWGLGDKAIQNTIIAAMKAGLTVAEAIDRVRELFNTNPRVTDITGGAPTVVRPGAPPAQPQSVPTYNPPTYPPVNAAPSIAQTTAGSFRAPTTSLLGGGGTEIANGSPAAAGATGAAAAIPTITIATADGSDAANAAGAAAVTAAAVTTATDVGGASNGPQCDPHRDVLVALIQALAAGVVAGGLKGVDALLTPGQRNKIDELDAEGRDSEWFKNIARGQRVHLAVRDLLHLIAPGEWIYRHGGPNRGGPDYHHIPSGRDIELTTPGEYNSHQSRDDDNNGPYHKCGYAFYDLPLE